jgi:hypothetical protein
MHKYMALALVSLVSIQGCAATEGHGVETVDLPGNGDAHTLDFVDALHPVRANPASVYGGKSLIAVTQWEDVTRCFVQSDFSKGDYQVCPGSPSPKALELLGAECQDHACDVTDVSGAGFHYGQITLSVTLPVASARLHVRVRESATGIVREDSYLLRSDRP